MHTIDDTEWRWLVPRATNKHWIWPDKPEWQYEWLTCKLSKFLIGVFNDPLDDIETDVKWENGFDVKLALSCNDESSGLLPVDVVPANVPMQLPFIDEFDNDEFDSDNEFRRP